MRIGISGHRDLGPRTAGLVDSAIRAWLAEHRDADLSGVSCLADGADQIFAQAVLDAGGQLAVIIPAERYRQGLPAACHPAYDALLGRAASTQSLSFTRSGSRAYAAASRAMLGQIDHLIAVWDGEPARGYGGTADVVAEASQHGIAVTVIWPPGSERNPP